MSLVSVGFLIFLAVFTLVYYLLPGKAQWIWLLLAGLVFYALSSYGLVLVPVLVSLIAWIFGKRFETKKSRMLMLAELLLIVGAVIFLKYAGWFGPGWVSALSALHFGFEGGVLVPLGISYFSVMAISYSMDVYRGTIKAEQNPARLLLFLTFFPVVTQGPILRYEETITQLCTHHRFSYENLTRGSQRMLWGFFKKLVIAERMAVLASHLSDGWGNSAYSGAWVLLAYLAYTLRLYMDFSGCVDIVLGAAEILGIRLPENFNHPYLSKTIAEFWRRWHITLGAWLRDYVMYSFMMSAPAKSFTKKTKKAIGRKAATMIVTCVGTLFVWLVYALWHDVSVSFLVNGAYFAFLSILAIVAEPLVKKFRKAAPRFTESLPYRIFMTVRTVLLCTMAMYLVFVPTLKDGVLFLGRLFQGTKGAFVQGIGTAEASVLGLDVPDACVLAASFLLWLVVSRIHVKKDPRDVLAKMPLAGRWAILLVLVLLTVILGKYGGYDTNSFVYQTF